MLGSIATCTIIAIEVGALAYSLHRQGVFTEMKDKLNKRFKRVADTVTQPKLKELRWTTQQER